MTLPSQSAGRRPDCFEFAMDFLGSPEEPVIREYIAALEAENSKLKGQLEEAAALTKAVESVRAWHGMGMVEADEKAMWDIYWNNSPEMEPIRLFLSKLKEARP